MQIVSQDWSDYLMGNNLFQHSGNQNYGENLAYFQGYGTDVMTLLKKSVDAWYNEISSYDFTKPGFSVATGHFTCLVWVSSTHFAIGITINQTTSEAYIVFNTSPPGNIHGEFQTNVLPVKTTVPIPIINPPIPPIEISNTAKIIMVINDLHNIIYSINKKQPTYFIINYINNAIQQLSAINNNSMFSQIINNLYMVIKMIQTGRYKANTINIINNIINQLKLYT
jgi:hypothetical protein